MQFSKCGRNAAFTFFLISGLSEAQSTSRVPIWHANPPAKTDKALVASQPKPTECWYLPMRGACAGALADDRNSYVNTFWNTAGPLSFFNQIKSVYNAASDGTIVAADLAALNFTFGGQMVAGANLQAAPAAPSTTSGGQAPTLSASSAGQAAQNMLHGGTLYLGLLYPLVAVGQTDNGKSGHISWHVNMVGREGIDLQSFKSGTNISVTSPPSHTNAQMESYFVYNSSNSNDAGGIAGAFFFGGSYGYGYTSHLYAREYGFGPRVSRGIAEVSFGILINNVATITASRGFGPSQAYIDAISNVLTRVNDFKAWSIGITYQADNSKKN